MSISQVLLMTTASLLASLALSSPLMVVTKLEVRKNLYSDIETSFCYEVNIQPFMREYLNISNIGLLTSLWIILNVILHSLVSDS